MTPARFIWESILLAFIMGGIIFVHVLGPVVLGVAQ